MRVSWLAVILGPSLVVAAGSAWTSEEGPSVHLSNPGPSLMGMSLTLDPIRQPEASIRILAPDDRGWGQRSVTLSSFVDSHAEGQQVAGDVTCVQQYGKSIPEPGRVLYFDGNASKDFSGDDRSWMRSDAEGSARTYTGAFEVPSGCQELELSFRLTGDTPHQAVTIPMVEADFSASTEPDATWAFETFPPSGMIASNFDPEDLWIVRVRIGNLTDKESAEVTTFGSLEPPSGPSLSTTSKLKVPITTTDFTVLETFCGGPPSSYDADAGASLHFDALGNGTVMNGHQLQGERTVFFRPNDIAILILEKRPSDSPLAYGLVLTPHGWVSARTGRLLTEVSDDGRLFFGGVVYTPPASVAKAVENPAPSPSGTSGTTPNRTVGAPPIGLEALSSFCGPPAVRRTAPSGTGIVASPSRPKRAGTTESAAPNVSQGAQGPTKSLSLYIPPQYHEALGCVGPFSISSSYSVGSLFR